MHLQLRFYILITTLQCSRTVHKIFDVLYTPYIYQETLPNNNLINKKKQLGAIK